MATAIKFGTDGWRGIIADDFTFDNVRRVGNAMATYVHKNEDAGKGLVVRLRHAFGLEARGRNHLRGPGWPAGRVPLSTITRPLRPRRMR